MNGLPDDGKIVVVSPVVAARLHELAPDDMKQRIYTLPWIKPATAYVFDLDEIQRQFDSVPDPFGKP